MEYPSITGDWIKMWELRSMTRLMRAVKLSAVFTSDAANVNVDKACFKEDSDLMSFLESPYTRLSCVKHLLIPFIREPVSHECRQKLLSPPAATMEETRRVIAQMTKWRSGDADRLQNGRAGFGKVGEGTRHRREGAWRHVAQARLQTIRCKHIL